MWEVILSKYNYWIYAFMLMIGFYAMMAKNNLLKKLIGMNIFQWALIFYFISIGAKKGGTVPIIPEHGHGEHHLVVHAIDYINPLPHVLMLTAIVVGVATTGIALALLIMIYRRYGTLEEDEIIEELKK
ncbi:MAG: cation:proton antiporter subunit C [Candidatus Desulfofervidus auxilii]|nr:cation:proton antiporter subunit C [Candidatus Desulfofervidus auxilii]